MSHVISEKVTSAERRAQALTIIEEVFLKEKRWVQSAEDQIPEDLGTNHKVSWFIAFVNNKPAGVLRLYYDPPLELPKDFEVTLKEGIDIEAIKEMGRFVEVGRFMILPEYRKNIRVALRLMRSAIREVVTRDYTHFITDVFEGEAHSPFKFHTRILGFEVVGKHMYGELNCSCSRIILTLDILKAYRQLKKRRGMVYRDLTYGIRGILDNKLA